MNFDLHIHSKYSHDSVSSPQLILKTAKKCGLDGIAVTDHNTIRGGFETFKANKDDNLEVIVGEEIKTEFGDVIGLFLNEDIKLRSFDRVVEEIKSQGGLSVLAHPYRQYRNPEKIADRVDLIEAFNSRSRKRDNEKSYSLAARSKKPISCGSDAHLSFEIGRARLIINGKAKDILKNEEPEIQGEESSYYFVHGLSVAMEKMKKVLK